MIRGQGLGFQKIGSGVASIANSPIRCSLIIGNPSAFLAFAAPARRAARV
jgi:hypothetical protein